MKLRRTNIHATGLAWLVCLCGFLPWLIAVPAQAAESSVVLMYHRFDNDKHPATSLSLKKFEAHIKELKSGAYTVLALPDLIDALEAKKNLPDKSVVITIDDAYLSVQTHAWPLLKKSALPFTLFVTTQPVDMDQPGYMSWGQLKEMANSGVTFGAKAHSLARLATQDKNAIKIEVKAAARLLREKLGVKPVLFSFPYGIASLETQKIVRDAGYKAAFGQHSGVLHRVTDRYFLPRFSLTDAYGDIARFRTLVNAQPLPGFDVTPKNPMLTVKNNPPLFGFSVFPTVANIGNLACYHSHFGKLTLQLLGKSRVEIRFKEPFAKGRSRINCTMPGTNGRWRWFGMQYYMPGD
jgi:peptidoglycan/xylan/chitin deacetylase (PgdA/CDA1 family)